MNLILLISGLVFVICMFVLVGGYFYIQSSRQAKEYSRRVQNQARKESTSHADQGMAYFKTQFLQLLQYLGNVNKPKDKAATSHLRRSLITAGYRNNQAPIMFLGAKMLFAVVFATVFLVFGSGVKEKLPPNYFPILLVASGLLGFYGPQLWLRFVTNSRKERMLDGFPDALDLMVVCVEAGLGLDQAINRIGQEIQMGHPDLAEEFELLSLELRAGLPREQGLRNLGSRTDLEEIRSLVALLVQTDRFGTSIGQALRVHSDSMRMNRRLRAEELAAKLPVKMMVPLILFIFPALMVAIIGPGAIRLIRQFLPAMGGG